MEGVLSLGGGNWLISLVGQSAFSDEQKAFILDVMNVGVAHVQAQGKIVYALLVVGLLAAVGVWAVVWVLLAGKGGNA